MRWSACLLLCAATAALAEDVDRLDIGRDGARYRVALHARLDAPLADSYAVFADFHNLPKINDAVEAATPLPSPQAGVERWHTRVRVCVAFFCTHLEQVQDVRRAQDSSGYRLDASVIPEMSNLRYGQADWQLAACGAQTCLSFNAELEPDFWVPPLLGPWLIERALRREAHVTAAGIETLAIAHRHTAGTPPP